MTTLSEHLPLADGNHWARGRPNCKFGIVSAPELTGAVSLHLERLVQAKSKQLVFCDCRAGKCAYNNMRNLNQRLIEEARRDPRMQEQAQRHTHPDIEVAESLIAKSYIYAPPPSIRFVQASEPSEKEPA